MSNILANNLKNLETNLLSLSEMTWLGVLYFKKILQMKTSASPAASIVLLVSMKIACFVSLSMTTNISVYPLDSSSCSMKSIEIDFQG